VSLRCIGLRSVIDAAKAKDGVARFTAFATLPQEHSRKLCPWGHVNGTGISRDSLLEREGFRLAVSFRSLCVGGRAFSRGACQNGTGVSNLLLHQPGRKNTGFSRLSQHGQNRSIAA